MKWKIYKIYRPCYCIITCYQNRSSVSMCHNQSGPPNEVRTRTPSFLFYLIHQIKICALLGNEEPIIILRKSNWKIIIYFYMCVSLCGVLVYAMREGFCFLAHRSWRSKASSSACPLENHDFQCHRPIKLSLSFRLYLCICLFIDISICLALSLGYIMAQNNWLFFFFNWTALILLNTAHPKVSLMNIMEMEILIKDLG